MGFGPPESPCDMCEFEKCGMCEWSEEDFEAYNDSKTEYLLDREDDKEDAGYEGNW